MQVGTFEIPENRLVNSVIEDVKKIYNAVTDGTATTKDIGDIFGYKDYATGIFYRRLNAMLIYGLLEQTGRGTYIVSDLGVQIIHPENVEQEKLAKNKAIFHVDLWEKLYNEYKGSSPPTENFWAKLKNIANMDPIEAKKVQNQVRNWYMADITHFSKDLLEKEEFKDHGTQKQSDQGMMMNQQIGDSLGRLLVPTMGDITINDEDTLSIARSYLDVLEKKIKEKKTGQTDEAKNDINANNEHAE